MFLPQKGTLANIPMRLHLNAPGVPPPENRDPAPIEEMSLIGASRRNFLVSMVRVGAAAAVAAAMPYSLAGCTNNEEPRREPISGTFPGAFDNCDVIKAYEARYPDSHGNMQDLLNAIGCEEGQEGGHGAASYDSGHGFLKLFGCWGQVKRPLRWFSEHIENLALSTFGPLFHLLPGDSRIENWLARPLPAFMTAFNATFRGILAPETFYALFMTFIDRWGPWTRHLLKRGDKEEIGNDSQDDAETSDTAPRGPSLLRRFFDRFRGI